MATAEPAICSHSFSQSATALAFQPTPPYLAGMLAGQLGIAVASQFDHSSLLDVGFGAIMSHHHPLLEQQILQHQQQLHSQQQQQQRQHEEDFHHHHQQQQQQQQSVESHHQQQQEQQQQHRSATGKKSRADYSNASCAICNAPADGLHYGAISCRSCNAFFRRAVTFRQTFLCRKGGNCDVDVSVRCACRACRLNKCKGAGMRESDVQPKRDPTGSQKNRRAPQRKRNLLVVKKELQLGDDCSPTNTLLPSVESLPSGGGDKSITMTAFTASEDMGNQYPYQTVLMSPSSISFPPSAESGIFDEQSPPSGGTAVQYLKAIKKEEMEPTMLDESGPMETPRRIELESNSRIRADQSRGGPAAGGEHQQQAEFEKLIRDYREHMLWMNRAMTPIPNFLSEEFGSCSKWREMQPADVDQLSKVELSGLMYWIEKMWPFRQLEIKEREILFKRYSVRKLTLDHAFTASKYPELLAKGHFAMLNNTFVPPERTGFETVADDKHTREAKFQILRPTIDRLMEALVYPFANLQISEAEVVALHLLLMWSSSNNRHLMRPETRQVMARRREWTVQQLFRHYKNQGHPEPHVRLGEIMMLLPELEVVCDMHCKDFQVAQLFDFCNMSEYWYENYCFTNLNIA